MGDTRRRRYDPAGPGVVIEELPDDRRVIQSLAAWLHGEWGALSNRPRRAYTEKIRESLDGDPLPLTLVAFLGDRPVGCASCWRHDMRTHRRLSPWLAAVYVEPELRRRGIGGRLCMEVERRARVLSFRRLYLFTPDRESFYLGMDWSTIERVKYRSQMVAIMEKRLGAPEGRTAFRGPP